MQILLEMDRLLEAKHSPSMKFECVYNFCLAQSSFYVFVGALLAYNTFLLLSGLILCFPLKIQLGHFLHEALLDYPRLPVSFFSHERLWH